MDEKYHHSPAVLVYTPWANTGELNPSEMDLFLWKIGANLEMVAKNLGIFYPQEIWFHQEWLIVELKISVQL